MANKPPDDDSKQPTTDLRRRPKPPKRQYRLRILSSIPRKVDLVEDTSYVLGKKKSCNLPIPEDSEVSGIHAYLTFENGVWCLRDAESSNGIWELDVAGHETGQRLPQIIGWAAGRGVLIGGTPVWMELVPTAAEVLRGFRGIVGRSAVIRALCQQLQVIARHSSTVMLGGESGTGKSLVARVIHQLSGRKGEFIYVNCGALGVGDAASSELFGHIVAAFTGATTARLGAFRAAEGGTLFLDEIGDLSLDLQVKLLSVLEEREVKPLGSDKVFPFDVRIIVATHKNPTQLVAEGKLRSDFFYRVNVVPLRVPSLWERVGDMPDLLNSFTQQVEHEPVSWSLDVVEALSKRELPGNLRELRNLVERLLAVAVGQQEITLEHLKLVDAATEHEAPVRTAGKPWTLDIRGLSAEQIELEAFRMQLAEHGGNATAAGRALGFGETKSLQLKAKLARAKS